MVVPQTFYFYTRNLYFAIIGGLVFSMGIWSLWYDGEKII
jgi:hypothetical protein